MKNSIHRATQTDINSYVLSRLSKVSDSSSLTLSIGRIGRSKTCGRTHGVKNRSKVQRIVDEFVDFGIPN